MSQIIVTRSLNSVDASLGTRISTVHGAKTCVRGRSELKKVYFIVGVCHIEGKINSTTLVSLFQGKGNFLAPLICGTTPHFVF